MNRVPSRTVPEKGDAMASTSPRSLIGDVRFQAAGSAAKGSGLLGYVALSYGDLRIDPITIRRTRAGRLELSFPTKRRRRGGRAPIVWPKDAAAREAVEAEILAHVFPELVALGLEADR